MNVNIEREDVLVALQNILRQEIELHRDLLKSSKEETGLIIDGRVDLLMEKTREIENSVASLRGFEQKRIILTRKLGETFGLSGENLTLSRIIGEVPESFSMAFSGQMDEISCLLEELRAANQSNAMLLKQSLDYIDFNIKLLSGVDVKSLTYEPKGKRKEEAASGLLDQRA